MKIIYTDGNSHCATLQYACREELLYDLKQLPKFTHPWHIINFQEGPLSQVQVNWANYFISFIINNISVATSVESKQLLLTPKQTNMFRSHIPSELITVFEKADIYQNINYGCIVDIPSNIYQIPVISAITFVAKFLYRNPAAIIQRLSCLYYALPVNYEITTAKQYTRVLNTYGRVLAHSRNGSTGLWCLLLFCQAVFDGHLSSEVFSDLLVKYEDINGMNTWYHEILDNNDDVVLLEHYPKLYAPDGIRSLFEPRMGLY